MLRIVKQSVVLPASPKALYAMYLSPRAHGAPWWLTWVEACRLNCLSLQMTSSLVGKRLTPNVGYARLRLVPSIR